MLRDKKLLLILSGIGFLFVLFLVYFLKISDQPEIKNLEITNLSNNSATISWTTPEESQTKVWFSESNNFTNFFGNPLSSSVEVAYDDRDLEQNEEGEYLLNENKERKTHHVTLRNLDPEKEYFFRVGDNDSIATYLDQEGVEINNFKTAAVLEDLRTPDPAYGEVTQDGVEQIEGIVFVELVSGFKGAQVEEDLDWTQKLSVLISPENSYSVDLANLRFQDLASYYTPVKDDTKINIVIKTSDFPTGLAYSFDLKDYQPLDTIQLIKGTGQAKNNGPSRSFDVFPSVQAQAPCDTGSGHNLCLSEGSACCRGGVLECASDLCNGSREGYTGSCSGGRSSRCGASEVTPDRPASFDSVAVVSPQIEQEQNPSTQVIDEVERVQQETATSFIFIVSYKFLKADGTYEYMSQTYTVPKNSGQTGTTVNVSNNTTIQAPTCEGESNDFLKCGPAGTGLYLVCNNGREETRTCAFGEVCQEEGPGHCAIPSQSTPTPPADTSNCNNTTCNVEGVDPRNCSSIRARFEGNRCYIDYTLNGSNNTILTVNTCSTAAKQNAVDAFCNQNSSKLNSSFITNVNAQASNLTVTESGKYIIIDDEAQTINEVEISIDGTGGSATFNVFDDLNKNGVRDAGEPATADQDKLRIEKTASATTYSFNAGWNLISFPFVSSDISTSAKLFTYLKDRGVEPVHIAKFENGQFTMYSQRADGDASQSFSNEFNILPGRGYFIKTAQPKSIAISGNRVLDPVKITPINGWNLIAVHGAASSYTAESLITKMSAAGFDANIVGKYESGLYVSVVRENNQTYGNDYNLIDKSGYFVRIKEGAGENKSFTP